MKFELVLFLVYIFFCCQFHVSYCLGAHTILPVGCVESMSNSMRDLISMEPGTPKYHYTCIVLWRGFRLLFFFNHFGVNVCGSLNENGSHRLLYLNAWFTVGGTIWEGLKSVALLDDVTSKHTVFRLACSLPPMYRPRCARSFRSSIKPAYLPAGMAPCHGVFSRQ